MELSRRDFLLGMGALGAAAIAGCQTHNTTVMRDLPDGEALPVPPPKIVTGPPSQPPLGIEPIRPFSGNTFGIFPRSAWTRTGPVFSKIQPMDGVRKITFHHSGDQRSGRDVPYLADGYTETVEHLAMVQDYHRSKGWADIGYHFGIDRMGRVWQLRNLAYQGAHVKGHDEHNIGIVVLGNFNVQTPTAAQQAKILSLGRLVRNQYLVDASAIYTHKELGPTDCPGNHMQPYMVQVRRQGLI